MLIDLKVEQILCMISIHVNARLHALASINVRKKITREITLTSNVNIRERLQHYNAVNTTGDQQAFRETINSSRSCTRTPI